jgi:FixJ family two-component response regulator
MPEMNGKQLSDAILLRRPGIAVMFISGYTADVIVDHGVLEKDVLLLQKPFDAQSITAKIQTAIRTAQNRSSG